jgi:hypothetical protein
MFTWCAVCHCAASLFASKTLNKIELNFLENAGYLWCSQITSFSIPTPAPDTPGGLAISGASGAFYKIKMQQ